MSLRSQIQHAIDDVAPPTPNLERRVKAFVFSDHETRKQLLARPRSRWNTRLRGTMALVAAALVVALIGGLFLAGRIWRNENLPPETVGVSELKGLESRPLNYPVVAPGAPCPTTPVHLNPQIGMVLGDGPVYVSNGEIYETNDWGFWVALAFASDRNPGLVLVRARDLQTNAQVAFAKYPLEPTPMIAVGSVLGTSRVANHDVQMRSEAAVPDVSRWPSSSKLGPIPEVITLVGMQKGSSGCIGFQIDASGFSENLVAQPAVPGL